MNVKRVTGIGEPGRLMFSVAFAAEDAIPAVWDLARHERAKAYERHDEDRIELADAVLLALAEMWPTHIPCSPDQTFTQQPT